MQQVLEALDAAALRAWCSAGLQALTLACAEIDDLNVFPVPDGDTGTNLRLTLASVVEAVDAAAPDHAATVQAITRGSLMGARGNSGVILSQLLRGLVEALPEQAAAADLVQGLRSGATSAYAAVGAPVEGTILTVAREAGEGAAGATLADVVRSARAAAEQSLARTPDLLPALAAAGVVDAGGRGWCVLLEALEQVVTGEQVDTEPALLVARDRSGLASAREAGSDAYAYEVQFLLRETTGDAVEGLKAQLSDLGDSLVVVGADGLFNVHVHVNDVGAAVEAGVEAGRPFRITVTRFAEQVEQQQTDQSARLHRTERSGRTVVAVAAGAGLAALFRGAGATVVDGGPTNNPSTAELLRAIRGTGAAEVVLLPNDSNVRAVAHAAADQARAEDLVVAVVPTRSVVQGLAAVSVADAARAFDDDVAAMGAAAGEIRWAEVTTAVRDSTTDAGPCRAGDALGLLDGAVVLVGEDTHAVAQDLLHRMLAAGGEVVTIVLGEGAADGSALAAYAAKEHPAVEVHALAGGQPHYPYLIGVE